MFVYIELPVCCEQIQLEGAKVLDHNRIFNKSKRLVNNRPLYVDDHGWFGVWFDGRDRWIIGMLFQMELGEFGFLYNREGVDCPDYSESWREYFDEWAINNEVKLSCVNL